MEMLLLWNVMQNKKFQYDVKVWKVFGLCPLVIWTRLVGVNYWLSMEKMLYVWPFKVEEMGLPVTLIWIRPSPQCVRTAGRNKTLRRCAIRPLKEDNIMHTRLPKCDEAFSVQTYQRWTNQYVMNSYIMLLSMREWFC